MRQGGGEKRKTVLVLNIRPSVYLYRHHLSRNHTSRRRRLSLISLRRTQFSLIHGDVILLITSSTLDINCFFYKQATQYLYTQHITKLTFLEQHPPRNPFDTFFSPFYTLKLNKNPSITMMSTNLVSCFVFFVMFGYLEKQLSMGWVVSGMLLMYTLLSQRSLLSSTNTLALVITFGVQFALSDLSVLPVLQKIHLPNDSQVLQFYPRPRLCGTVFLVFLFLFTRETTSRDDDVTFGPYEQQLRKYLLKHDPSMLHKVKLYCNCPCMIQRACVDVFFAS